MGKFWDKLRRVQDMTRPFCTAIVPAAGSSTRMGGQDKLLADLCGTPVLMRTPVSYTHLTLPTICSV